MSTNNTQRAITPLETVIIDSDGQNNINQVLSIEIVTISQPFIQFNLSNMIPSQPPAVFNHQQEEAVRPRIPEARRRRRQRRAQRRRQQRALFRQRNGPRDQQHFLYTSRGHWHQRQQSPQDFFDRQLNEAIEDWQQAQVNDIENFEALEQEALMQDYIEQEQQIQETERMEEEQQQQINAIESWEQQRLQDFERSSTTQEDELLHDYDELLRQIDLLIQDQQEALQQMHLIDQWNQERVLEFETIPISSLHDTFSPLTDISNVTPTLEN